ncbi:MAG: DUF1343 domain-containing protein [Victivallales bacterium]|nr:DUF1343 domain-containing protein [Victivallales bacterium]
MTKILNGIDNTTAIHSILKGKHLGLITNPSGVNSRLESTADLLHDHFNLQVVFGPEHGIRGDYQAGVPTSFPDFDPELRVRSYSLYGKTLRPTPEMLDGIDMMVYDIQDVGARFYTYIYTLCYAMQACAEMNIPMTVLDRINPLGGTQIEGILLNPELHSFVGEYPIPTRYGLTVGEFARYANDKFSFGCELNIVPCLGMERSKYYDASRLPWIMPSPNIPTLETAFAYIGTCIFEGTDISEGRGTTHPFEIIGAPQLDAQKLAKSMNNMELPGVIWRPVHFTPMFSKHANELCHGIQIHITDRRRFRPFTAGLLLYGEIQKQYPTMQADIRVDRLLGDVSLRNGSEDIPSIIARAKNESAQFLKQIKEYWLYQ